LATAYAALAVTVPLAGGEGAPELRRGPYLQALLERRVEIVWLNDAAGPGSLRLFRALHGDAPITFDAGEDKLHRVRLERLIPETDYRYQILSGANGDPLDPVERVFRTAPPVGSGRFTVAVAGDSGSADVNEYAIAGLLQELRPNLFIHTGDWDYTGDLDMGLFEPFREVLATSCLYPCRGNHDFRLPWRDFFFPPNARGEGSGMFYSFDYGPAHFISFDTNGDALAGGAQSKFVREDVAAARAAGQKWMILFCHEPPYTVGGYGPFDRAALEVIPPLADELELDLVISGHDHNYQRCCRRAPGSSATPGTNRPTSRREGRSTSCRAEAARSSTAKPRSPTTAISDSSCASSTRSSWTLAKIGSRRGRYSPSKTVLDEFSITKGEPRPEFRVLRGDANTDGTLDLADPVRILDHLFLGRPLGCEALVNIAPSLLLLSSSIISSLLSTITSPNNLISSHLSLSISLLFANSLPFFLSLTSISLSLPSPSSLSPLYLFSVSSLLSLCLSLTLSHFSLSLLSLSSLILLSLSLLLSSLSCLPLSLSLSSLFSLSSLLPLTLLSLFSISLLYVSLYLC
jgi:hypothetical protein